jgi:hypothetical protein
MEKAALLVAEKQAWPIGKGKNGKCGERLVEKLVPRAGRLEAGFKGLAAGIGGMEHRFIRIEPSLAPMARAATYPMGSCRPGRKKQQGKGPEGHDVIGNGVGPGGGNPRFHGPFQAEGPDGIETGGNSGDKEKHRATKRGSARVPLSKKASSESSTTINPWCFRAFTSLREPRCQITLKQ